MHQILFIFGITRTLTYSLENLTIRFTLTAAGVKESNLSNYMKLRKGSQALKLVAFYSLKNYLRKGIDNEVILTKIIIHYV